MKDPRFLYSQQTYAAYKISKLYYGDIHWVICSEYFGPGPTIPSHIDFPPTSTPRDRYRNMWKEIKGGDTHSSMIAATRAGLLLGANEKFRGGLITSEENDAIIDFLNRGARVTEFRPLLYFMKYSNVKRIAFLIPAINRANPLYREYRIERLPGKCFEVLDLYNPYEI